MSDSGVDGAGARDGAEGCVQEVGDGRGERFDAKAEPLSSMPDASGAEWVHDGVRGAH